MSECLFCKIARRDVPAQIVYDDADMVAFRDIHPKYRTHILLIPKEHLASVSDMRPPHDAVVGKLLRVGAKLAKKEGIASSGFRLTANAGPDAGQVVPHLHVHLLGGEPLRGL